MSVFDGLRDYDPPEYHPWQIAKDMLGLVLAMVCAVEFALLAWLLVGD
jgi:hypothetical protein